MNHSGDDSTGLPFPDAEVHSNKFPELLEFEAVLTKKLGVEPAQAGMPAFDQMVQNAEQNRNCVFLGARV
jgi:hypothetical protein